MLEHGFYILFLKSTFVLEGKEDIYICLNIIGWASMAPHPFVQILTNWYCSLAGEKILDSNPSST